AQEIDKEMQNFINYCYDRAKRILTENKDKLELIAKTLLEVETLDAKQIKSLFEDGILPEPIHSEEDEDVKVNIKTKSEEDEEAAFEYYEETKNKAKNKLEQETKEKKKYKNKKKTKNKEEEEEAIKN